MHSLSEGKSARLPTWFKAALFALLAGNTVWFFASGATSKGLDAAAWLALLALFEFETRFAHRLHGDRVPFVLRAARLAAGAAVIASALGYLLDDNVLDAINSALWIAVVVMLELQLRYPHSEHRPAVFAVLPPVLYAALGALVLVWGSRAEWFDAYDALLWLVAFATLERTVVGAGAPHRRIRQG